MTILGITVLTVLLVWGICIGVDCTVNRHFVYWYVGNRMWIKKDFNVIEFNNYAAIELCSVENTTIRLDDPRDILDERLKLRIMSRRVDESFYHNGGTWALKFPHFTLIHTMTFPLVQLTPSLVKKLESLYYEDLVRFNQMKNL